MSGTSKKYFASEIVKDLSIYIQNIQKAVELTGNVSDFPFREAKRVFERQYLIELLTKHRGNITRCAQQANMDRKNFKRKLKKYDLNREDFLK
jgi:DNA-binding NtrC family response regulator